MEDKPLLGEDVYLDPFFADGLVGCYLMNENAGDKVYDLSGNDNTGDFDAAGTPTWGYGGISFDGNGSDDSIILPNNFGFDDLSIVLKFKANLPADSVVLFSITDNAGADRFLCGIESAANGRFLFIYDDINNRGTDITGTSKAYSVGWNPWSVIVFIIGKSQGRKMYRDGILVGSDSYSTTGPGDVSAAADGTRISGYQLGGPVAEFPGIIDHVYIFNRALSESETALFYQNPFWGFRKKESGIYTRV